MKPQDLRIGNYVRIKDNRIIVKVESLTLNEVGFHFDDDDPFTHQRKYSKIEPVLIREVKDSLPSIPDLMWADKAMCEDLYYYKDVVITDLHELQNLHFALTGNEIEIEL